MSAEQSQCLFCRISAKQLPADILFEDDHIVAFHDLHPKAKVHVLVIPKKHIHSLADAADEDTDLLGRLLQGIKRAGEETGIAQDGYRTIINTRSHGGQEIDHLHIHILGGEPLGPMRGGISSQG